MDIVDAMLAEHDRILIEADDLERMCRDLVAKGAFSNGDFDYKVRFIREFSDAAHHRKERKRTSTLHARAHLGQVAENLVATAHARRRRGRACVKRMEDAQRLRRQPVG